jgi:hypothetical protein
MGHIYYHVPMIRQGDENPICWIACVAMVTSFKDGKIHPISEFTGGFDPSSACIPDPNEGWDDLYAHLMQFGFKFEGADRVISPAYIEDLLRRHGPIIMFVNVMDFPFYGPMCLNMDDPSGTHAMVISGIDNDSGKVMIVNPWGTRTPPADVDVIVKAIQDIADDHLFPIAYK